MKYAEIPERAMNSDREGARPSFLAMPAMESMMCCLSDIFEVVRRQTTKKNGSKNPPLQVGN